MSRYLRLLFAVFAVNATLVAAAVTAAASSPPRWTSAPYAGHYFPQGAELHRDSGFGMSDASADGRYVVFESYSNRSIFDKDAAAAVSPYRDAIWRDRVTGQTALIGVNKLYDPEPSGITFASSPSVCNKGNAVAYVQYRGGSNPGGISYTDRTDVNVKNPLTGIVTNIRVDVDGTLRSDLKFMPGPPQISGNCRYVVWSDAAELGGFPGDTSRQCFVRDLEAQKTTMITKVNGQPAKKKVWFAPQDPCAFPSISDDGQAIAFATGSGDLVPGLSFDQGMIVVAKDGKFTAASVDANGKDLVGSASTPTISGDGSTVAFPVSPVGALASRMPDAKVVVRNLVAKTTQIIDVPSNKTAGMAHQPTENAFQYTDMTGAKYWTAHAMGIADLSGYRGPRAHPVQLSTDGSVVAFTLRPNDMHESEMVKDSNGAVLWSYRGATALAQHLPTGTRQTIPVDSAGVAVDGMLGFLAGDGHTVGYAAAQAGVVPEVGVLQLSDDFGWPNAMPSTLRQLSELYTRVLDPWPGEKKPDDPPTDGGGGGGGGGGTDPKTECSDGVDNDGDGKADALDPQCIDPSTGKYDPKITSEGKPECSDGIDNDKDGKADASDPQCLDPVTGKYNPLLTSEAGVGPASVSDCVRLTPLSARSTISSPFSLGGGATARLVGPDRGFTLATTPLTRFRVQFKGKGAAGKVSSVTWTYNDGKLKRTDRKAPFELVLKSSELQPGQRAVTAQLSIKRSKVKRTLRSAIVVRNCPPPTMAVFASQKRAGAATAMEYRFDSGGPDRLSSVRFAPSTRMRGSLAKSLRGKRVGRLVLRDGKKTVKTLTLKAPKKAASASRLASAGGVSVTWSRQGRLIEVKGLPDGVTGVWVKLDAKPRMYKNPNARVRLVHAVHAVDRLGGKADLSRVTQISRRANTTKKAGR